jgi:hypothetical protein
LHHAIYGYTILLQRDFGPAPHHCLLKISDWECSEKSRCVMYNQLCYPHEGLPACWNPTHTSLPVLTLLRRVIHGWGDGTYFVIVEA